MGWKADKKSWCCRIHHVGCPQPVAPVPMPMPAPIMPAPIVPRPPADPYNCADGFANWVVGWSVGKKEWCCRVHGKGCPGQAAGCAPVATSAPYDCNAGFANWMAGWSAPKKDWCCKNAGKVAHQQLAAALESPVRLVSGVVEGRWRPRHLPA